MNLVQNCTVGEVAHCFVSSLELLLHYVKIILQERTKQQCYITTRV